MLVKRGPLGPNNKADHKQVEATPVEFNDAIILCYEYVSTLCQEMACAWRHQAITLTGDL